jgi:hypothetical protein
MEFQRKWRKIDREFQRAAYNSKIQLTVSPGWGFVTQPLQPSNGHADRERPSVNAHRDRAMEAAGAGGLIRGR